MHIHPISIQVPSVTSVATGCIFLTALIILRVCLVLSFAMGLSLGSAYWNPTAKGALKSGTLSIVNLKDRPALTGQIIRSGERGVLLYEPVSDRIRFELWAAITSIETTPAR
jgi:hypothetical protein